MKRISFIQPLAATLLALTLTSCPDDEVVIQPYLNLSPSSIHLNINGEGGYPLFIESNVDWSAESNSLWINLSKTSGKGNASLTVTAKPNPWETERMASVIVTAGELKKSISVYQSCDLQNYDLFVVTPKELTFDYISNEPKTISITADQEWIITGVPEWLELSAVSGNGNSTVTMIAKANLGEVERKAELTVTVGKKIEVVKVTQNYEKLVVTPKKIELDYSKDSTGEFNIITVKQWSISGVPEWLKLSAVNGTGKTTVIVTAEENLEEEERKAELTITVGGMNETVEVTQNYDKLVVTPKKIELNYSKDSAGKFNIITGKQWSISGVPDWLELSAVSGTGNATVVVTAKENLEEEERTAELTVMVGGKNENEIIEVTQNYEKLIVTPTKIDINYSKNSTGTFNITIGKQWSISGVPDWLELSAVSGTGNSKIYVTALTDNIDTQPLSATLIVETDKQMAKVTVNQRSSMSVTFSDQIVLSNGYWCQYIFNSGVSGYADIVCKAEYYDNNEQAVQQYLEESETYTVASRTDFTVYDLPSQTTLVHCIAPYTLRNGVKKWGKILTNRFTTPASTASAGVNISAISHRHDASYGYYWSFRIALSSFNSYYILAYNNSYAIVNRTTPDILFAKFMYQNPSSSLSNKAGDLIIQCTASDYALLLVAWGGMSYGNITKSLGSSSSYAPAPSQSPKATSPAIHQYYKTNTEDIKRWEETFKSCRIVTMPNNVLTR